MTHWLARLGMIAAMAAFALGAFAACDDDGDEDGGDQPAATATSGQGDADGQDVQAAVQRAIDAWNANDADALIAAFTDAGLISAFGDEGMPVDEVRAGLPGFIGEPPIENLEFLNTTVEGAAASADIQWEFGPVLEATHFALVQEGGEWKINAEEDRDVEVPAGTQEVGVDAREFAFDVDLQATAAAGGPLALNVSNIGQQEHELGLARIPADANLDELLRSDDPDPAGVEFIGGVGPIVPGDDESMVLLDPLGPGRYVLVCFLPDTSQGEEGQPHALLGMVAEFTVPGASQ